MSRVKWRQVAQVTVRGCGCDLGRGFMGLDIAEGVVDGQFDKIGVGGGGVDDVAAVGGLVADGLVVGLVPYNGTFLGVDEDVLAVVGVEAVLGFVHFLGIAGGGVCFHDD